MIDIYTLIKLRFDYISTEIELRAEERVPNGYVRNELNNTIL